MDNALVKIADPVFVGYCAELDADCAAKVSKMDHSDHACGVNRSRNIPPARLPATNVTVMCGDCVGAPEQVIAKAGPHEKVGVIMLRDAKVNVVEYSEIDKAMAEATNPDGSLVYSACHVCINFFSRAFFVRAAAEMVDAMPLHVAHKAIQYYDADGDCIVKPESPNGIKMELFIFDTFPFAERFAALEVYTALSPSLSPLRRTLPSAHPYHRTALALTPL